MSRLDYSLSKQKRTRSGNRRERISISLTASFRLSLSEIGKSLRNPPRIQIKDQQYHHRLGFLDSSFRMINHALATQPEDCDL